MLVKSIHPCVLFLMEEAEQKFSFTQVVWFEHNPFLEGGRGNTKV